MLREIVLPRVVAVCMNQRHAKRDITITEKTHIENDLGLDSLDQVEFEMALEDEFNIEIPDEEADTLHTVEDVVNLVADHPHAV